MTNLTGVTMNRERRVIWHNTNKSYSYLVKLILEIGGRMNKKNGITWRLIPALLVLVLILTACGAPAETAAPATEAPATEAPATEPPEATEAATEAPATAAANEAPTDPAV